ncbi:hypothetical protein ACTXGW_02155 [Psychrobacter faecalis]|uniref:DUF3300 domain-containing protein n=1 Tax=Psychrobacter faecalis TaxID=180588 RepID=A0ABT9HI69_9GAMM|nr:MULTISPECIES: hypothetical protein [Psychrobacter]MDP4545478.1 hypothetical protein [Psychrobacter faecalis]PKG82657.1 hypothetical protein CXF58_12995 [Psychrobacter sp. Sarcosine-02u-2]
MFKNLLTKPDSETHHTCINAGSLNKAMMSPRTRSLLAAAMTGVLLLSGCQQQAEAPVADNSQPKEKTSVEDSQPMRKSDSAAARIEQFQPLYLAQAKSLQQRLQAEYESLQAADASDSGNDLLPDSTTAVSVDNAKPSNTANRVANNTDSEQIAKPPATDSAAAMDNNNSESDVSNDPEVDANATTDTDINTSTEVGERDLTVLKRISLEPRKPVMLTDEQIIDSYQQAMEALYQPVTTLLSAEDVDTLINIATLVPQVFEHAEIAGRLSAKSPALARLIIQHQVWEQIEAQQVMDMQQMKLNQQQEFERLMAKFNETIQGYDEQIAKYEQTLKEFQ